MHEEEGGARDQLDWTPEFSRRARGFTVYAAIRQLGRSGIAELVERCCDHATRFAAGIPSTGAEVLNEVVFNQVLFRYDSDERTLEILSRVQESGEAWMSGSVWQGRQAIRLSVSNWQTSEDDIDRTIAAFAGCGPVAELAIRLRGVVKRYGQITAVNHLDLDVPWARASGCSGRTARASRRRCGC